MNPVEHAAEYIRQGSVVVFTGSGISAESNIPAFRGEEGLWRRYDPARYVSIPQVYDTLMSSPTGVAAFITDCYGVMVKAGPNRAHECIAAWEKTGLVSSVVTQNIDNLHQQAGSQRIYDCTVMRMNWSVSPVTIGSRRPLIRSGGLSRG